MYGRSPWPSRLSTCGTAGSLASLASLGMWMANQTPLQVMLALQLQDITPRHKIAALGVVTGVGAVSSAGPG